MANILQQYVPGPADIFVGTGAAGILECLGFCERDVMISLDFPKNPVRTSITGQAIYDSQFMGKGIRVTIRNLNLYDEEILVKLLELTSPGGAGAGAIGANTIGTLLRQEGFAPRCLVRTRYGLGQSGEHPAFRRMIPVINIPHIEIVTEVSTPISTEVRTWNAVFQGIPAWNPVDGSAIVWNYDSTGIPTTFEFMEPGDTPIPTP